MNNTQYIYRSTRRQNRQNQKQPMALKDKVIATLFLVGIIAIIITLANIRYTIWKHNRDEYAKRNNCTWVYTGTLYGDNRDYICK